MNLATELYADQTVLWPREGRHILAHHDAETVIVYQAYRPSIAAHAIRHGRLGASDQGRRTRPFVRLSL